MYHSPVLEVSRLYKKIGKETILEDISVVMNQGEILGLLGPNGSGKTTLLKCMVGLLKPTKGHIQIKKHDLHKEFEAAIRHVGAIIENPELYEFLTGYDNLVHFLRMSPGVDEDRIEEVVKLLEMDDYIDDKVYTYSLGMRQRLGLGQAILHRPSILLLDEPTNGLDPAGIKDLRMHLMNLARNEGVSIMISSHILAEIELICDRVIVINDGRVIDSGRMEDFKLDSQELQTYFFKVSNLEQVPSILQQYNEIEVIEMDHNGFSVRTTEQNVAALNKRLVQSDIQVYAIERAKASLEDAFFRKVERD